MSKKVLEAYLHEVIKFGSKLEAQAYIDKQHSGYIVRGLIVDEETGEAVLTIDKAYNKVPMVRGVRE